MMTVVDKPGFFGHKRCKRVEFYNNLFGENKWFEAWRVNGRILTFEKAVELHDAAYLKYFQDHPDMIEYVLQYGDCYSQSPCDIQYGCQHDAAACPRHLHDISIRRALQKLGVWFEGPKEHLLAINKINCEGHALHPGIVPFHIPELILERPQGGPIPVWAHPESVAAFWQSTKVIVIE